MNAVLNKHFHLGDDKFQMQIKNLSGDIKQDVQTCDSEKKSGLEIQICDLSAYKVLSLVEITKNEC